MMIKYRVREVAKDLDIPNKDVIDILAKYFPEPKKYMTALTEEELDVVFEAFTQQRSMKSLDEYFAQRASQEAAPPRQPLPSRRPPARRSPSRRASPSKRRRKSRRSARPPRPSSLPPLPRSSPSTSPPAAWWTPVPPM